MWRKKKKTHLRPTFFEEELPENVEHVPCLDLWWNRADGSVVWKSVFHVTTYEGPIHPPERSRESRRTSAVFLPWRHLMDVFVREDGPVHLWWQCIPINHLPWTCARARLCVIFQDGWSVCAAPTVNQSPSVQLTCEEAECPQTQSRANALLNF